MLCLTRACAPARLRSALLLCAKLNTVETRSPGYRRPSGGRRRPVVATRRPWSARRPKEVAETRAPVASGGPQAGPGLGWGEAAQAAAEAAAAMATAVEAAQTETARAAESRTESPEQSHTVEIELAAKAAELRVVAANEAAAAAEARLTAGLASERKERDAAVLEARAGLRSRGPEDGGASTPAIED